MIFDDLFYRQNRFACSVSNNNLIYQESNDFLNEIVSQYKNVNGTSLNKKIIESYKEFDYVTNEIMNGIKYNEIQSHLFLHKINDINQALNNIKLILNHDGIFYGSFFGHENIMELAYSTLNAQTRIYNQSIFPMVLRFIDIKTLGMLFYKNGFKNVSVMNKKIITNHNSIAELLNLVRTSGGPNGLIERRRGILNKNFFKILEDEHLKLYGALKVTFDINYVFCKV
jgi:hypothetical protein